MRHTTFLLYGLTAASLMAYSIATYAAPVDPQPAENPVTQSTPLDGERQAQQAALKQRVVARWDALIQKDFAAAYSYNSPAYRRLYSIDAFKRNFGNKVVWRRIDVVGVNFQGDDAATVGINLFVVYHDAQSGSLDMATYIQESWVRVDGQWWYLMKE